MFATLKSVNNDGYLEDPQEKEISRPKKKSKTLPDQDIKVREMPLLISPMEKTSQTNEFSYWNHIQQKVKILCGGFFDGCKIMHSKYWLEVFPVTIASLKLHLYPNDKWLQAWKENNSGISYHEYMRRKLLAKHYKLPDINVMYFSDKELNDFRTMIHKNKLYRNSKLLINKNYIFVLNPKDELFIGKKSVTTFGKIQHSSFTRGGPVKSAGWIKFDTQGDVIEIANFSGHYRPSATQVMNILYFLRSKDVNLSKLSIVFSPSGLAENFEKYSLQQWLKHVGMLEKWNDFNQKQ